MSQSEGKKTSVKTTVNAGYITDVFEALEGVRDEGKVKFTEKGIYSKVSGQSNAMMAVCRVKGQALNGITIRDGDELLMGCDFEEIYDTLTSFKSSTELQVEFPHTVEGSHAVKFNAPDEGMYFMVTVLDKDTVPDIPQADPLSHKRRIVISGSDFKSAIGNAERFVSDDDNGVELGTDSDTFYINSSDKVDGSFRKEFYQSGPNSDNDLGNVSVSIGHPLLDKIKGTIGSAESVTVHVAQDKPLRIDVDLDETGDAQIIYIIAPRLDS